MKGRKGMGYGGSGVGLHGARARDLADVTVIRRLQVCTLPTEVVAGP
jgi:hypothetical protein